MDIPLNPTFLSNIHAQYGSAGKAWLANLPRWIEQLAAEWQFQFIEPHPNLSYGFVAIVFLSRLQKTAILKIAQPKESLANQVRWYKDFSANTPEVYAFDEERQACLLEHLEPGNSLKARVTQKEDDQATAIICETILALQAQKSTEIFPHLSTHLSSFAALKGKWDAKLHSKAEGLFKDLTSDRRHDIVLHGDLHHDNILESAKGWKVIDPHGYIGDPVFEVGPMIYNPLDAFPTHLPFVKILNRRLAIMSERLPFDHLRIKAWTFCMSALSAAWTLENQEEAPALPIAVAEALSKNIY